MTQTLSFRLDFANEFGLLGAVIINRMAQWVYSAKVKNKYFFDGRTWTHQTIDDLMGEFPWATYEQIKYQMEKLIAEDGPLLKSNYNKNPMDRTSWYAFKDEKRFVTDKKDNNNTQRRDEPVSKEQVTPNTSLADRENSPMQQGMPPQVLLADRENSLLHRENSLLYKDSSIDLGNSIKEQAPPKVPLASKPPPSKIVGLAAASSKFSCLGKLTFSEGSLRTINLLIANNGYSEARVANAIERYMQCKEKGDVKNPEGYFIELLKKGAEYVETQDDKDQKRIEAQDRRRDLTMSNAKFASMWAYRMQKAYPPDLKNPYWQHAAVAGKEYLEIGSTKIPYSLSDTAFENRIIEECNTQGYKQGIYLMNEAPTEKAATGS